MTKFTAALALSLALVASTTTANEIPPPQNMFVSSGILCSDELDLQKLLTHFSLNPGEIPDEMPGDCGMFSPRDPIPFTITPLYWYETPLANILVARFDLTGGDWVQFGWIGFEANPDYIPSSTDPAL